MYINAANESTMKVKQAELANQRLRFAGDA